MYNIKLTIILNIIVLKKKIKILKLYEPYKYLFDIKNHVFLIKGDVL